jgi:hypothetical protein
MVPMMPNARRQSIALCPKRLVGRLRHESWLFGAYGPDRGNSSRGLDNGQPSQPNARSSESHGDVIISVVQAD